VDRSTGARLERGAVIAGRYAVGERIARGGMSVVYRVEHVRTGEELAMKVLGGEALLDPEATARFQREARTSTRLRSEHVVRVIDADIAPELDGAPFLVMELLRGEDLESHVVRCGPLSPDFVVGLFAQIGSVLDEAHRLGIVHRDLKPANLFLHERADGAVIAKVLDFGVSKLLSPADAALGVTSTGVVLGTPLYMSPEQANGRNDEITPATDVWALGLIAMRLLTGEHYWGRPTMAELISKITSLPIVPPSERWPNARSSPALDAWFLRSCDRDRTRRWSSVAEQTAALAVALGTSLPSPSSGAASLPTSPPTSTAADTDRERLGLTETAVDTSRPAPEPGRSRGLVALALLVLGGAVAPWALGRIRADTATGRASAASAEPEAPSAGAATSAAPEAIASARAPGDAGAGDAASGSAPAPPPRKTTDVRPTHAAVAPAASSSAAPPSSAGPAVASCPEGEVPSSGHCCPSGHVWHSGRCARPFATSF
jgi:serine/threonine protein kinase